MTEREKHTISEIKAAVFERDGYKCRACGGSIYQHGFPHLAHGIANTISNKKKYGEEVVNHSSNLYAVCSLYCNSKMNIGFQTKTAEALADEIRDAMLKE